jgi:hypothetical protein
MNRQMLVGIGLCGGSTALLAVASVCRCSPPRWVGVVDVAAAFALTATAGIVWTEGHRAVDVAARRVAHDITTTAVPAACLVLWVLRASVDWNTVLPGLAWRSFLVLHSLPAAVALWRGRRPGGAG